MNKENIQERIFLFGNGATLSIDPKLKNLLIWGIEQLRDHKYKNNNGANEKNLLNDIQEKFKDVLSSLQILFRNVHKYKHTKKGTEMEEFKDIYEKFSDIIDTSNFLYIKEFLDRFSIEDLTRYIFDRAYDSSDGGYGWQSIKKNNLIGPMDGTVINSLEKLQVFILSLFCLKYQNKPTVYDDFVRLLSKEENKIKKVISLNWDNFYEQAFRRIRQGEESLHIFISNQMAIDVDRHAYVNEEYQILKPHGSLEYYCCQSLESSSIAGCFRVTVIPQEILCHRVSYAGNKCLFHRKLRTCKYYSNLFPFIQPYTRIERSLRSIPFVRMALEASKEFLSKPHKLVVIGYSFSRDNKGWIDYDLLPLFLAAESITIISKDKKECLNIKKNMLKELPIVDESKIIASSYNGFEDYIERSKQAGYLL